MLTSPCPVQSAGSEGFCGAKPTSDASSVDRDGGRPCWRRDVRKEEARARAPPKPPRRASTREEELLAPKKANCGPGDGAVVERPTGIVRLGEAATGETEHATASSARKKGERSPITGRGRAHTEHERDSEGGSGVEDETRASSALWETGGCTAEREKEHIAEVAITNDSAKNKVRSRRNKRARPAERERAARAASGVLRKPA